MLFNSERSLSILESLPEMHREQFSKCSCALPSGLPLTGIDGVSKLYKIRCYLLDACYLIRVISTRWNLRVDYSLNYCFVCKFLCMTIFDRMSNNRLCCAELSSNSFANFFSYNLSIDCIQFLQTDCIQFCKSTVCNWFCELIGLSSVSQTDCLTLNLKIQLFFVRFMLGRLHASVIQIFKQSS